MKVSLRYIASQLQVSVSAVSLVLNGKEKEARIARGTADKIKQLAKELNYSPNRFAKGLKDGRSGIIGVIVADISNLFFARLTRFIEDEAEKYGFKILIGSSDESATKLSSAVDMMMSYQVDGFIIAPTAGSDEKLNELIDQNIPVVLIDRYLQGCKADTIIINNREIAAKATQSLFQSGCSSLAAVTYDSPLHHFRDRLEGFTSQLIKEEVNAGEGCIFKVRFENFETDIKKQVRKIVDSPHKFDGIFFATNTLALYSLKSLSDLGVNISEKFKVISFDENIAFTFLPYPVPHSVQPLKEMGSRAVEIIKERIAGSTASPQEFVLQSRWIEE